jgi:hypothetical protein
MFYLLKRVLSLSVMLSLISIPLVHADVNADLKEVHKFELTEKRLDQYAQALRNMEEAVEKNPEMAKENDSVGANASIDEMVAGFEKIPPIKKSVESAGMTTREFVLFQMALFSAAMGHYVVEQGQKLPAEISPEHVKFYKAHQAKFEALKKEWEAMDKKMKANESDEEDDEDEDEDEEEDEDEDDDEDSEE